MTGPLPGRTGTIAKVFSVHDHISAWGSLVTGPFGNLGLRELATGLRQGNFSAVELAEECLRRAAANTHGAWRKLTPERALSMAREADRLLADDHDLGPLHGIPVGLKDNINMEGEVSLAGLDPRLPMVPEKVDSSAVELLERAGAVLLGRTHMTELAFTALGLSDQGTPLNPLAPDRVPGGSSSGSAVAVAAGEVPVAIGTDTGGSIRIPAAYNGIAGLKPGSKRLDMRGVFPLSNSLDTLGPLAGSAADAEIVYSVLDPRYLSIGRPGTRRALVPESVLLDGLDSQVAADFEQACELLAASDVIIERGPLPLLQEIRDARRFGSFAGWEAYRMYGELLRSGAELIGVADTILAYGKRDPEDYLRLQQARADIKSRLPAELEGYDLILSPTTACLPPLLSDVAKKEQQQEHDAHGLRNTQLFNFLGLPALAVPMGELTSLSIAGLEGHENLVLAVGKVYESART